ncbi:hypothetical protein [Lonomia obliqua multiple nucleopolyhedrovirus]|uniref:Uncharacterized protein n=1 Tax=Lonomia obliqua multiple nucleopolyhedrovirus TaxID=134394 RepID=A0A126FC79_9ABAC|nr:hypothetical protein [Lonomia obliqua multiple nucleopolyhedrovirus]AKN81007.1 hypothetical protein [Lonomia obliqua multiple nucleopolyhedrovirus]
MYSKSKDAQDLTRKLNEINFRKKQILIKTQHLERLKLITKDARELRDLEQKLLDLRYQFLNFSVNNF